MRREELLFCAHPGFLELGLPSVFAYDKEGRFPRNCRCYPPAVPLDEVFCLVAVQALVDSTARLGRSTSGLLATILKRWIGDEKSDGYWLTVSLSECKHPCSGRGNDAAFHFALAREVPLGLFRANVT